MDRLSSWLKQFYLLCNFLSLIASSLEAAPPPTFENVHYGPHERNVLDFWKAPSDKPTPVVFYMHGGGWMFGDKDMVVGVESYLRAGISVASLNYRFTSHAVEANVFPPVKAPMDDAALALQFIRSMAIEWKIDKNRIAGTGRSAGACTCLWLALHDDMSDPNSADPIARESTRLDCAAVVRAQTTLDPLQMRQWTPNSDYGGQAFGFTNDPTSKDGLRSRFSEFLSERSRVAEWIEAYSPYSHVSSDDPPIYLWYDSAPTLGKDAADPTHTSNFGIKLQERLLEVHVPCELVFPDAPSVKHATELDYIMARLGS